MLNIIVKYIFIIYMSVVVLKKKTKALHNISSVKSNFSINGTYRNSGWIGQTSLSRYIPKPNMNGAYSKGYGGNNGKYEIKPIIRMDNFILNDDNVLKKSSISNNGMISTKYRWIRRPYPFTTVVSNSSNNINKISDYIHRKKIKNLQDSINCYSDPIIPITFKKSKFDNNLTCKNNYIITKNNENIGVAITQSEYINILNFNSIGNDNYKIINNTNKTPLSIC